MTPPIGQGFGMSPEDMRKALHLAKDMERRVAGLLGSTAGERQPLWPSAPAAQEWVSTQYCDWRAGGIQKSAVAYSTHLFGQTIYLARLIKKLEDALEATEAIDDEVAEGMRRAEGELS